jgi:hypothetical protein
VATVRALNGWEIVTPVTKYQARVLQVLIDQFHDTSAGYTWDGPALGDGVLRMRLPDIEDPGRHLRALRRRDPALWGPTIVCPEDYDSYRLYGLRARYYTPPVVDIPI